MPALPNVKPLYYQDTTGQLHWNLHPGQWRAWESEKRFVSVFAGTQGGKTEFGSLWLAREIHRCGPGDYLIATPTFKLLSLKLFPSLIKLFRNLCKWGDFTGKGGMNSRFLFSNYGQRAVHGAVSTVPTQIFFGHAQNPDSLESATVKAAWLDEAGQRAFKLGSWEAVQRRCSVNRGRILLTTTPYTLGWLKDQLYEPWKNSNGTHEHIDVVQFKSTDNPAFPQEEYERTKATMPAWRHRMFYDGEWERPAGAIYDTFDKAKHVCAPFDLPPAWKRFIGTDFGGVHTAAVFLAEEPGANRYFVYRTYPPLSRWVSATAAKHAAAMLAGEPRITRAIGGSSSEQQWRDEFRAGGLPIYEPPVSEVEVGIDRVHSMLKNSRLVIFNTCAELIDDIQSYAREVDDTGNPTEKIEDKDTYHRLDALRYICAYLAGPKQKLWVG